MSDVVKSPRVLVSEEKLRARVRELAHQITRDYEGREVDVICTLGGAVIFFSDLVRALGIPTRQHYLGFTSHGRGASGEARITLDIAEPLEGRHVLVVEGAVISGRTPRYVLDVLQLRRPASLTLCALITKPQSLKVELPIPYVGFEFGAEVVSGYGMGHGPERALPYLVEAPNLS